MARLIVITFRNHVIDSIHSKYAIFNEFRCPAILTFSVFIDAYNFGIGKDGNVKVNGLLGLSTLITYER